MKYRNVNVNVRASTTIQLSCNAHLADSSVEVGVNQGGNSSAGVVGVHVGSNVNVQRVGCQ
ncbi:MAG: hypothetical protein HQK54_04880 [Oligoflexales bacterium]|nr:hypothetical protein [Oligoflexales bacterium]